MALQELLESVRGLLDEYGVAAAVQAVPGVLESDSCRMICITGDLGASRSEMKSRPRDNVMMVRVDDESLEGIDAWIKAGVANSRSEAAALFIREGLNLRGQELEELKESIEQVEQAKAELRSKARTILGEGSSER